MKYVVSKLNVFFDTSLLIDLLYKKASTKNLSAEEKAYFLKVADECNGFISPITYVEFFYHSFVRTLMQQGSARHLDLLRGMTLLPIDQSTASYYLEMGIPHDSRPGALDAWQIVIAKQKKLILATSDKGMRKHAKIHEVSLLHPTTHPI